MPTTVTCPNCQKKFNIKPEYLGKKIRCSGCQSPFLASPPQSEIFEADLVEDCPTGPVANTVPVAKAIPVARAVPVAPAAKAPIPVAQAVPVAQPIPMAKPIPKGNPPPTQSPYEAYAASLLNSSHDPLNSQHNMGNPAGFNPLGVQGSASYGSQTSSPYAAGTPTSPYAAGSGYQNSAYRAKENPKTGEQSNVPIVASIGFFMIVTGVLGLTLPLVGLQLVRLQNIGPLGAGVIGMIGCILVLIGYMTRGQVAVALLGSLLPGFFIGLGTIAWLIAGSLIEDPATPQMANLGIKKGERFNPPVNNSNQFVDPPGEMINPRQRHLPGNQTGIKPPITNPSIPKTPNQNPSQNPGQNPGQKSNPPEKQTDLNMADAVAKSKADAEKMRTDHVTSFFRDYNFDSGNAVAQLESTPPDLGMKAYSEEEIIKVAVTDSEPNSPERDMAPESGVLVGVTCHFNTKQAGSSPLCGLEPIYQVGTEYVRGKLLGESGNQEAIALAEPGYVAVGVNYSEGRGVQLVTAQMKNGRINTGRTESTSIIGEIRFWKSEFASNTPVVGLNLGMDNSFGGIKQMSVYRLRATAVASSVAGGKSTEDDPFGLNSGNSNSTPSSPSRNPSVDATNPIEGITLSKVLQKQSELRTQMVKSLGPETLTNYPADAFTKKVGRENTVGAWNAFVHGEKKPMLGMMLIVNDANKTIENAVPLFNEGDESTFMAENGYAVAGVNVIVDKNGLKGIQPIFMKIAGDHLDTNDQLVGKWYGKEPSPGKEERLGADGKIVHGIAINGSGRVSGFALLTD